MSDQIQVYDPASVPGGKLSAGVQYVIFRGDEQGALLTTNLMGRYRENVHRLHSFSATTSAIGGQVTTVGLATTYTGLMVYNPVGSGVVCSLDFVSTALLVAEAAPSPLHLASFAAVPGTLTTPVTVMARSLGSATIGSVLAYSSVIFATAPVLRCPLNGLALAGAAKAASGPVEIAGLFEAQPGYGFVIIATTLVTGFFGISWTEIPV